MDLYRAASSFSGDAELHAASETIQIFNRYCEIKVPGAIGTEGSLHTDSTLPSEKKPLSFGKYISLLKSRKIIPNFASVELVPSVIRVKTRSQY